MSIARKYLEFIDGLVDYENYDSAKVLKLIKETTRDIYTRQEIYGDVCAIQAYVDCPPQKVFAYLQDVYSLCEWSYGIRDLKPTTQMGVYAGVDRLIEHTNIYVKVEAHASALTVDYHCAWDQGDDLWMIYLFRIVPANLVLNRSGSVIFWQNCHHPHYDKNPYPEIAPEGRVWVGELWPFFAAGHTIELNNIKKILEYRHHNNLNAAPSHFED